MLNQITQFLSKWLLLFASLLFLIGVLVLLYGVCARYVFNFSPIWMDELSRYMIIGSVLLAAGTVYARDEHMRVSVIQKALKGKLAKALSFYHWILIVGLTAYLSYISFNYSLSLAKFSTIGLGISKAVPVFALPVGFSMLCLIVLLQGPKGASSDAVNTGVAE